MSLRFSCNLTDLGTKGLTAELETLDKTFGSGEYLTPRNKSKRILRRYKSFITLGVASKLGPITCEEITHRASSVLTPSAALTPLATQGAPFWSSSRRGQAHTVPEPSLFPFPAGSVPRAGCGASLAPSQQPGPRSHCPNRGALGPASNCNTHSPLPIGSPFLRLPPQQSSLL